MSTLPIELLWRIFELRTNLCYQISRDSWKIEWMENITGVNTEYNNSWSWSGLWLSSTQPVHQNKTKIVNYRGLHLPHWYRLEAYIGKMDIARFNSPVSVRSNFPMMHYFYSLRRYPNAKIGS